MQVRINLHGALAAKSETKTLLIDIPVPENKEQLISALTSAVGFNAKSGIYLLVNGKSIHEFFNSEYHMPEKINVDMYTALMGG